VSGWPVPTGGDCALSPRSGAAGAACQRPPGRQDLHPHDQGTTREMARQGKGSGSSPVSLVSDEGWRCGGVRSSMVRLRWSSSVAEWSWSTREARRVRRGLRSKENRGWTKLTVKGRKLRCFSSSRRWWVGVPTTPGVEG
jgi:hypothetical protein